MLIMEYADGGTLRRYLTQNFKRMDWNIKLDFAKQIASAVYCLHEHEIVHRDLVSGLKYHTLNSFQIQKLNHFLIMLFSTQKTKNNVKIGDFGISKRICEQTSQLLKGLGNMKYTDPECLKDPDNYVRNMKSDVYSLGMLFWEISSGRIPFESDSLSDNYISIINGKREKTVEGTPLKYVDIYTGILRNYLLFMINILLSL